VTSPGRRGAIALATLVVLVATAGSQPEKAAAADREPLERAAAARVSRSADSPPVSRATSGVKAPSSPPLTTTGEVAGVEGGGEETGSPEGEADPLVSNGLGSPLCKGALGVSEISATARRNCETSGFVAARAPTSDYGIDVHINTGVLGLSSGGLLTTVQDLFVTPLWMALVWAVHALVVMLEWCFTIDLLDTPSVAGGVASALRQMQASITDPWLASVLAVASVLALYNGLVRRRVAETVGQALLVLAMMVGGTWVMLNPAGTVGALGGWANEAGLGTFAVTSRGTPARAGQALADGMSGVFAAAIEVPWCYLEFGDVGWCRSSSRLDPRLRAAGLKIAAGELQSIGCGLSNAGSSPCVARGSAQAKALEHSAQLLRDAQSNGAVFLALPANGPARNAINDPDSLLRVICQSSDATNCHGPAAAEAQFRTNGGTWARVGGLLLIVGGVLGMLLLLGFIALRLLAAALLSLLYLMLAPAVVLAPALGESGRAAFRKWGAQLLGAVVSKLLFSFLLGVVLAVLAVLANLEALGWWTQWLLMSAFWWGAYARRHQALEVAGGTLRHEHVSSTRTVVRRMSDAFESPRRAISGVRSVKRKISERPPEGEQRRKLPRTARPPASAGADDQAARTLQHDRREARAYVEAMPKAQERVLAMGSQLERVRAEQGRALSAGDTRRAGELAHRAKRIETDAGRHQDELRTARRRTGDVDRGEQAAQRNAFLDAQAALPSATRAGGLKDAERRDYGALAGLAGYGRREYERLDPGARRAARLEIDRELASRAVPAPRRAASREGHGGPVGALAGRTRNRGHGISSERSGPSGGDAQGHGPSTTERPRDPRESSVMRDAREVAGRRKRQLGRDRR
jgi:hypothetical protein